VTELDLEAELARLTEGRGPLARITELLRLDDRRATGARIIGVGAAATGDIHLDDGSRLELEDLKIITQPAMLNYRIALQLGVDAQLDRKKACQLLIAMREAAEAIELVSSDRAAIDFGVSFLQEATPLEGDMSDQADRWRLFEALSNVEPRHDCELNRTSYARGCRTVVGRDGRQYVRTGWFQRHVRESDWHISPPAIATAIQRVGWVRPGREGRMKATRRSNGQTLIHTFYIVPAGWLEAQLPTEQVTR
jgi:hypothetical protein